MQWKVRNLLKRPKIGPCGDLNLKRFQRETFPKRKGKCEIVEPLIVFDDHPGLKFTKLLRLRFSALAAH